MPTTRLLAASISFSCREDSISRERVLAELAAAGIGHRADASGGPTILLFDSVDSGLRRRIGELSRGGTDRLLAVVVEPASLGPRDPWTLLRAGASDVMAWDGSGVQSAGIAARLERWHRIDELACSPLVCSTLVGASPAWLSVIRQIIEVAHFSDSAVLVRGESGTGKELVARLIHALDPRQGKGELVILDCTTVVPTLSGSEFFGHEKGAFTGAAGSREGAFAMADGGTLFLDEVGELALPLQAELLRVIQEGTYKRVGGNTWRETNFRLVCATNRDLEADEAQGRLRRDFYYRIAAWTCTLPSLRERPEDIPLLASHFLRSLLPESGNVELTPTMTELLVRRPYPGNVRDLRQLIARMARRHVGPGPLTPGDVPPEEWPAATDVPTDWRDAGFEVAIRRAVACGVRLQEIREAATDTAIRAAIDDEGGNLARASRRLGVTARALQLRRAARRAATPSGRVTADGHGELG